jgi:hypothetical protein
MFEKGVYRLFFYLLDISDGKFPVLLLADAVF